MSAEVHISLEDIYERVCAVERTVTELSTCLRIQNERAAFEQTQISDFRKDTETRLRQVERKVFAIPSAAVVVAVVSLVWSVIAFVSRH